MTPAEGAGSLSSPVSAPCSEGWNPGLHAAETPLAAEPGGSFVHERGGRGIRTVPVVHGGDGVSFGGPCVLRPGVR